MEQFAVPLDPLYLFACGVLWRTEGDTGAGWELVHGLKSREDGTRAVAAGAMAKTRHGRLLARDLRRARSRSCIPAVIPLRRAPKLAEVTMKTPYGMEIVESCASCKLRKGSWFCGLPPDALQAFSDASRPNIYPGGALLFVEGQAPRGVFVVCGGKVKLSTTSRDGKILILKVAEDGEVLGLSAAITGTCYEITAETIGPCQVNFVKRDALLKMMEKYGELGSRAALALSREFQSVYRDIHELVLSRSSAGKLARLLLSWSPARDNGNREVSLGGSITHEEIAQMIGASRETVTRLLSELKKKEFIRIEGSTLVIRDRPALEALAA
ncbi:MAG TPA: Crp/Fnr family transcriptional regulator [Terriglobales bacterium]|nr:Crp/Fnr family transcriptional regulator [Terriglobales bacterium]